MSFFSFLQCLLLVSGSTPLCCLCPSIYPFLCRLLPVLWVIAVHDTTVQSAKCHITQTEISSWQSIWPWNEKVVGCWCMFSSKVPLVLPSALWVTSTLVEEKATSSSNYHCEIFKCVSTIKGTKSTAKPNNAFCSCWGKKNTFIIHVININFKCITSHLINVHAVNIKSIYCPQGIETHPMVIWSLCLSFGGFVDALICI